MATVKLLHQPSLVISTKTVYILVWFAVIMILNKLNKKTWLNLPGKTWSAFLLLNEINEMKQMKFK